MHKPIHHAFTSPIKLFVAIALLMAVGRINAKQIKILWLGNSFTYTNNLPAMFQSLALSGGDTVVWDSYTPGGYTLQQHAQDTMDHHKIYSAKWDFVVLQAQSQEPSFPNSQVETATYPYAHILDSLVLDNDSCTQVVFYMTWGKKFGDAGNCAGYPVICSFDGITGRLQQSYVAMGDSNHALISPVGMAWYAAYHADTALNLWAADDDHPAKDGSYLAACVFYGTIFRKSPVGLTYTPLGNTDTTAFLQQTAYQTVFDSLAHWNIGVFDVHASMSYTGSDTGGIYQFNSDSSANYTNAFWYFGPADSAIGLTATHNYTDTGTFTARLIVSDNCGHSDTTTKEITIHKTVTTGITSLVTGLAHISPNPAHDFVEVNTPISAGPQTLQLFSVDGKEVYHTEFQTAGVRLDISSLAAGVYQLQVISGAQVYRNRVVKW